MSDIDLTSSGGAERPGPNLERRPFEIRALKSGLLTGLTWVAAVLAAVPLFSVIYMLMVEGGARCSAPSFSRS